MTMKVWLDDDSNRDPLSGWAIARTADEAIALLVTGEVEVISLDHDLGDFRQDPYPREVTGMDVVNWMVANKVFPKVINVHSWNFVATRRMVESLNEASNIVVRCWKFDETLIFRLEDLANVNIARDILLS